MKADKVIILFRKKILLNKGLTIPRFNRIFDYLKIIDHHFHYHHNKNFDHHLKVAS